MSRNEQVKDVVVIGGGLSGLYAARELRGRGWDVAVVEASGQVGGRTRTMEVDGAPVDVGGQWVGPSQKRMLALIREFGLHLYPQYYRGTHLMRRDGKLVTYSTTLPPVPLTHMPSLLRTMVRLDRMARGVPAGRPETAARARQWDALSMAAWVEREVGSMHVRDLLRVVIHSVLCVEMEEVSLLYWLHYIRTAGGLRKLTDVLGGGQEWRVAGGTQQISALLAEGLDEPVRTSWPVRRIVQDAEEVRVAGDRGAIRARAVVAALPPNQLARIEREPVPCGPRLGALERAAMGSSLKFIAFYDRPFWREEGLSGSVICPDGPVQLVFDACDEAVQRPALVGFIMAEKGRELCGMSAERVESTIRRELGDFFGNEAASPIRVVYNHWNEEPWTHGCPVCVRATGGIATQGRNQARADGRIFRAGTETASRWHGFMEGALEAGERAALEVHSRLCAESRNNGEPQ